MAEAESISRTEATVEQQEDFAALVRALTRAQGFALYFVECNVPVFRRKVAETVRARLERTVVDVDLSDIDRSEERPTVDYVLEQRLANVPDDAVVFVWGLDTLLPATTGDEAVTRHTLNEVNWRRGAWTQIERPLVVWLPEYALRVLARNAPDFFDWNSGIYAFETPEDERPALFEASIEDLNQSGVIGSLPVSAKRTQEAYLQGLKQEYSGDKPLDQSSNASIALRLGRLYLARGDLFKARQEFEEALSTYEETKSQSGKAIARHFLGSVAMNRGMYGQAQKEFREALLILQHVKDRPGEASTRHNLASIALNQGLHEKARREFEEALSIRREIEDQSGEAATRHQLATIALEQRLYEQARHEFEKVLSIYKEIGDWSGEATARHQLAIIKLEQGSYERARQEFEEVLSIYKEIGDWSGEATARHQIASIATLRGSYELALQEFEEALRINQRIDDRPGEATTLANLGVLAADKFGQKKEGFRLLLASYSLLLAIGHAQATQVEPWIQSLTVGLDYDETELAKNVRHASQSYNKDRGWSLIRDAFPDADRSRSESNT